MSVYRNPTEHAANPPETWQVVRQGKGLWTLSDAVGTVLEGHTTLKAAEAARESGFTRRLYDQETRWYAGESIPNWPGTVR